MSDNLAVLIDFENIAAGTEKEGLGRFDIDAVMARIKDKGRILIARSYADWGRFARFKQSLLAANVTMMELTSHGMQDKNRADIAMVVDCLELAFTRDYLDAFVVVSGDSDFTPLVLKMRELNKRVIGIGTRRSTSRLLINACDEFLFYDTIVTAKEQPKRTRRRTGRKLPVDREKAFELMLSALAGLQREDPNPPHASIVKQAMLRRQPDFNEVDLGFSSFGRFLEVARDEGLVKLERDKKSGGYVVDAVDEHEEVVRVAEPVSEARAAAEPSEGKATAYDDPYFPEGSIALVDQLHAAGLGPLSAPTRMTVLEALVEAVDERAKKRRRTTIPFVVEDLRKRLRRTHPELGASQLREVLVALLDAGTFIHKDGSPIRSQNASFRLTKDAEGLNKAYTEFCLRHLLRAKADLEPVELLAELFFGDRERKREVETTLAWLQASGATDVAPERSRDRADETTEEVDLDDLDALLVPDDASSGPSWEDDTVSDVDDTDLDALLVAGDDDDAPKPKKRRRKKKKPAGRAADADADAELPPEPEEDVDVDVDALLVVEAAEPEPEPEPEEPKKRPRRRKKAEEPEAAAAEEPEAAPAPKRSRRKAVEPSDEG